MGPLSLDAILGHYGAYFIYLLIGMGFGAVLEMAGFGNTNKLAMQFYFKDQTVLKVMFGAIVTSMVLVFLFSSLGLLDFSLVWVPPTYLWPGIIGGLIMGVGFIIGGFCPGTSLVAIATLKVDALFFVLGALTGIFFFGETVGYFDGFWHSSYMGRFTLSEWLGLDVGMVVLLVVFMALFMFWGAEQLERIIGGKDLSKAPKARLAGAGALLLVAVVGIAIGQPTNSDRWDRIATEKEPLLTERSVFIHPAELANIITDDQVNTVLIDVRDEGDYNLFHLKDAKRVPLDALLASVPKLLEKPANTVFVIVDNLELRATAAWKMLTAENVPNVYMIDGGLNNWLDVYGHLDHSELCTSTAAAGGEELRHNFGAALGSLDPAAEPDADHHIKFEFTPKVKIEAKKGPKKGGCG